MTWRVVTGDCVERMRELDECSVDAVVCDPPYGLEFMGKEWDKFSPAVPTRRSGWEHAQAGETKDRVDASTPHGRTAVAFGQRRGTSVCESCGKRDAFRNSHGCEGTSWRHEWVDPLPLEQLSFQAWCTEWATEALRVLKPGGHLLAFGGTRTYHRLVCAVEDAGFEIRDTICWLYGSGFPKSLDVSKAIDKAAGRLETQSQGANYAGGDYEPRDKSFRSDYGYEYAPATPEAAQWDGWGTALKPAHEPVVVARKPLAGTVAGNVLVHGTGALNVDGCRIEGEFESGWSKSGSKASENIAMSGPNYEREPKPDNPAGRWPANVVLDPESARALDEQTGESVSSGGTNLTRSEHYMGPVGREPFNYGDSGGASRFFYCAKASRAERNAGLEGFEAQKRGSNFGMDGPRPHTADDYVYEAKDARNVHPTVKPIDLMRWLVRLVTPPGGVVLDPFAGSGTTGAAAALEGFDFIGIERDADYARIAEARVAWWHKHRGDGLAARVLEAGREREGVELRGQASLFDEEAA